MAMEFTADTFDIDSLATYDYNTLWGFVRELVDTTGIPRQGRAAPVLRECLQTWWDYIGNPAGPPAAPPAPPAPPAVIYGAIVPLAGPAAPIPSPMAPIFPIGHGHGGQAPPLVLDAMFSVAPATQHEAIWLDSFNSISTHLEFSAEIAVPFRNLQDALASQLRKGDFILLYLQNKCFIYSKDGDAGMVSLRSPDFGSIAPHRSQIMPHVGVYILQTDAIIYFRHLAATNPNFRFDDCTSHKRGYSTGDSPVEQTTTPAAWNSTLLSALSSHADDSAARKETLRSKGLMPNAAMSLSANPDRVLKTGIFQTFQRLLNSAYLNTQTDVWNITIPFSIQLQPGHLLHLASSWSSLPIYHFASLDDQYGSILAAEKSLRFYRIVDVTVDDKIPIEQHIIGNDVNRFARALQNYAYVLDTIYDFHSDIRGALQNLCRRVEDFIRPRTQGSSGNNTQEILHYTAQYVMTALQRIYGAVFANERESPLPGLISRIDAIPEVDSTSDFIVGLSRIMFHTSSPKAPTGSVAHDTGLSKSAKRRQQQALRKAAGQVLVTASEPLTASPTAPAPGTVCAFYLSAKGCNKPAGTCEREHRNPKPADAAYVASFFKRRPNLTQSKF